MLRYIFKQFKRRPLPAMALLLFAAILSLILCGLQAANVQEAENYQQTYRAVPVTLTVTNLTGMQRNDLGLPAWAVRVFTQEWAVSHPLTPYIKDLKIKMELSGIDSAELNGQSVSVSKLVGVTTIEADEGLRTQNGVMVTWLEAAGDSIMMSDDWVCLIPESMMPDAVGTVEIVLSFSYRSNAWDEEVSTYQCSFQVVGTHRGSSDTLYCPYLAAELVCSGLGKSIAADSISATVISNDWLQQVRDEASHWFAEPNIRGERTPWDYSWYDFYPYALDINDDQLVAAAETMEQSIRINQICTVLIFSISAAAGFIVGFQMIRSRKREIILMRTMGTSDFGIYGSFAFEQMLCVILGTALGGGYFLWQPVEQLAVFVGVYFAGLTAALMVFLRKNLLTTIKEDE